MQERRDTERDTESEGESNSDLGREIRGGKGERKNHGEIERARAQIQKE
jgi:hypothetical protein